MSAFWLKIIAIIAMALNHIAHAFGEHMPDGVFYVFTGVGGMTFPIMVYLMNEGYQYTRDVKKYGQRLLVFAVISLVPFMIAFGGLLNVLFTLLLGLIVIYLYDHMKSRKLFWLIFILVTIGSIVCDWALMGIPMILCSHAIKNRWGRVIVPVLIAWGFMGLTIIVMIMMAVDQREIISNAAFMFGCALTVPLLLAYNGQRGPAMKYFFYAFYPAHLAVIAVIMIL